MYHTPKLVRYGGFRELTLQGAGATCTPPIPTTQKTSPQFDPVFSAGQSNDGCPPRS